MLQPFTFCFGVSGNTSVYGNMGDWYNSTGSPTALLNTNVIAPTAGKILNLHLYYDFDIAVGNSHGGQLL